MLPHILAVLIFKIASNRSMDLSAKTLVLAVLMLRLLESFFVLHIYFHRSMGELLLLITLVKRSKAG